MRASLIFVICAVVGATAHMGGPGGFSPGGPGGLLPGMDPTMPVSFNITACDGDCTPETFTAFNCTGTCQVSITLNATEIAAFRPHQPFQASNCTGNCTETTFPFCTGACTLTASFDPTMMPPFGGAGPEDRPSPFNTTQILNCAGDCTPETFPFNCTGSCQVTFTTETATLPQGPGGLGGPGGMMDDRRNGLGPFNATSLTGCTGDCLPTTFPNCTGTCTATIDTSALPGGPDGSRIFGDYIVLSDCAGNCTADIFPRCTGSCVATVSFNGTMPSFPGGPGGFGGPGGMGMGMDMRGPGGPGGRSGFMDDFGRGGHGDPMMGGGPGFGHGGDSDDDNGGGFGGDDAFNGVSTMDPNNGVVGATTTGPMDPTTTTGTGTTDDGLGGTDPTSVSPVDNTMSFGGRAGNPFRK